MTKKQLAEKVNEILVEYGKKTLEFAAGMLNQPKGITQKEYEGAIEEALVAILTLCEEIEK